MALSEAELAKTAESLGLAEIAEGEPRGITKEIRKKAVASVETITPAQARLWLGANVKNRDLRMNRVIQLAGVLAREEWELTTDGVGFDTEGFLRNGQHRLSAIVVAQKPAPMVVLRGMKSRAQNVTDQGLRRSVSDALKLQGETSVFVLGAALGWLYRFRFIRETGSPHYGNPVDRPTTPQLLTLLEQHPGIRDAVRNSSRIRRMVPFRSGLLAAAWEILHQIDRKDADQFFEQVYEGTELKKTDPAYLIRQAVINDQRRGFEKMPDYREAALLFKAWNAWREGKPMSQLSWKYSASYKEDFPIPK